MIPYKSSASHLKEKSIFNSRLFWICIGSEYAIDYLKEWFQTLKKLLIQIFNPQDLAHVTLWINFYIILNAFCINHEWQSVQNVRLRDGIEWEIKSHGERKAEDNLQSLQGWQLNAKKKIKDQIKKTFLHHFG